MEKIFKGKTQFYCILCRLRDVTLDTGVLAPGRPPPLARGVELCDCPPQYNSSSCQDPSIGFYRWYDNNSISSTIVIQLVGEARPCQCNQRSRVCNIETGYCLVSLKVKMTMLDYRRIACIFIYLFEFLWASIYFIFQSSWL